MRSWGLELSARRLSSRRARMLRHDVSRRVTVAGTGDAWPGASDAGGIASSRGMRRRSRSHCAAIASADARSASDSCRKFGSSDRWRSWCSRFDAETVYASTTSRVAASSAVANDPPAVDAPDSYRSNSNDGSDGSRATVAGAELCCSSTKACIDFWRRPDAARLFDFCWMITMATPHCH